jgi:GTP-binding protein HflX
LIDRPASGERAVLVHIDFPDSGMQEDLLEFKELARSAGATSSAIVTGNKHAPEPKYFVGSGKAEEIRAACLACDADIVLFNHSLTPAQERNLERLLKCRVLDRTGLILDIFAQRARSFEGKLQVELALLKHMATRLVRGWTHLERQRGGIGLRGPGETQLETDRRLLRKRIKFISDRLIKVREQREQGRRARRKASMPTVALVGYTNAGKSTLFNLLSGAEVYTADQLFATLDPTLRRMQMEELGPIILADTVGFIRHLPHDLVDAFRATLEEVCEADLLLHVIDMHDARMQENIDEVNQVLASIGGQNVPQIQVFNKMDLHPELAAATVGMAELESAMVAALGKDVIQRQLTLTPSDGRLRAALYELAAVRSETIDADGNYHLLIRLPKAEMEKLFR